jgi:hypothetical protein
MRVGSRAEIPQLALAGCGDIEMKGHAKSVTGEGQGYLLRDGKWQKKTENSAVSPEPIRKKARIGSGYDTTQP